MAKIVLNKSGLQRERENFRLYRRVLPSLDLKRRQLIGEQKKAEHALEKLRLEFEDFTAGISRQLPMLGAGAFNLAGFVEVKGVKKDVENVVGVKLPVLLSLEFDLRDYSILGTPQWVDLAVKRLRQYAERKAGLDIGAERVELLRRAARKITQRVNLFEKILIPNAKKNIKRIQIYLADAERAAVVQAKIAKAKSRRRRQLAANAGESAAP